MDNRVIIETLEKEKQELLNRVASIDNFLSQLKQSQPKSGYQPMSNSNGYTFVPIDSSNNKESDKYAKYNKNWTIRNKVAFVIKTEGHFLFVREIANIIHKLEGKGTVEGVISQVSPTLSTLKGVPEYNLVNKKVGKSNALTVWGSKHWIDDKGEIISKYKYDENFFSNNGQEVISL
ncbi:MAG: hypothetical protein JST82_02010 [Bacteroidetes bacterium]|nr:hypothetical protein [Bacteroidota bacterium]